MESSEQPKLSRTILAAMWLAIVVIVIATVMIVFVRPRFLRWAALRELNRIGRVEITDDEVVFTPSHELGPKLETLDELGILLERVECTTLYLGGCDRLSRIDRLRSVPSLRILVLWRTKVSDLSPLAGLTNLQELDLSGTRVSDVGLLAALTNLQRLDLTGTKVPKEQVEALRTKLPKCKISR